MPFANRIMRRVLARPMAMRRSQFEQLPPAPSRVVFLGDSITEQGLWDEWFPGLPTLNRGIGGNTIGDVIARLDSALHEPRTISLLIGTNDLSGLGRSRNVDDIAEQMHDLVTRIRGRAPGIPLLITSVMPRGKVFAERIRRLNTRYQQITQDADGTWIDLWSALAAPDGSLRADLTGDGLHLNGAGYQAWTDVLRPRLMAGPAQAAH